MGSGKDGGALAATSGVPTKPPMKFEFEGLRSAFKAVFGCKEVDEAVACDDEAPWAPGVAEAGAVPERDKPPKTAGPYAFQSPIADSNDSPGAPPAVPPGWVSAPGAPGATGCLEVGVLFNKLQIMSTKLERRV